VKSTELKEGNMVITPDGTIVKIVEIYQDIAPVKNIVNINGIEITYKHPIKLNGEWVLPKDYFISIRKEHVPLFNLKLEHTHEVILSNGESELVVIG
jgi:hypothetical protein